MTAASATIPVTVIGGFLGAGKTTFVNHLLRSGGPRTAVLVNDFGEVNVDATLIASHDGTTMTLTNGCICCSIGTSFIDTMCRVLDAPVPFERIVIEASGVGDPWKIAEIALIEPTLRLDRVIVLADASRIVQLIDDVRVGDTVRGQFERCDVVLLNKTDLIAAAALAAARDAVAETAPRRPDRRNRAGHDADAGRAGIGRRFEWRLPRRRSRRRRGDRSSRGLQELGLSPRRPVRP